MSLKKPSTTDKVDNTDTHVLPHIASEPADTYLLSECNLVEDTEGRHAINLEDMIRKHYADCAVHTKGGFFFFQFFFFF